MNEVIHIAAVTPKELHQLGLHSSRRYHIFERAALNFLEDNGWKVSGRFVTTDGDDFGPMVRILKNAIKPSGEVVDLLHG